MDSTGGNTENALVVYTKFNGDIGNVSRVVTSLREIRPEHRVVVEGGMYVASATNLKIEPAGFLGFLCLAFYQEITRDTKDTAQQSLSMLILDKFFKKALGKPDIVHDEKEYRQVWHLRSSTSSCEHWIIINGHAYEEAVGKIKVQLIEERNMLFSNAFLDMLFSPVLNSLLDVHIALGRF